MLKNRRWFLLLLGIVIFLGLLVRLIDLTDPPLDFNPTRQLRSAIIARGLYYQSASGVGSEHQQLAAAHLKAMERLEPPILEHLVAFVYRLMGAENLWVARIFSSLFWIVGGLALFDLGRKMSSGWGALIGVLYLFFLPFSIQASRSFQPDPLMVMLIILTAWALDHWAEDRTWKWALVAGLLGGLAILVKGVAVFFIGGMAAALVVHILGVNTNSRWRLANFKSGLRDAQVWVMAGLMLLPVFLYYLAGGSTSGYSASWTILARWRDVLDPSFFMRWALAVDNLLMLPVVLMGFAGSLVTTPKNRALLWGAWIGYFLFGLTFPYHIVTHDYYHLPLVAITAFSLTPLAGLVIDKVATQGLAAKAAFAGVVILFAGIQGWIGRSVLVAQDYRHHPAFWQEVSDAMPTDGDFIGYTQDYGARLMYYGWRRISLLPPGLGADEFEEYAQDADYFLSTASGQLSDSLKDYLGSHYSLYAQGVGYVIYDLTPAP